MLDRRLPRVVCPRGELERAGFLLIHELRGENVLTPESLAIADPARDLPLSALGGQRTYLEEH